MAARAKLSIAPPQAGSGILQRDDGVQPTAEVAYDARRSNRVFARCALPRLLLFLRADLHARLLDLGDDEPRHAIDLVAEVVQVVAIEAGAAMGSNTKSGRNRLP